MGTHGSFRMVSRILNAIDNLSFVRLPGVGQLFDALIPDVCDLRESLRVARLSSAIGSDLTGIGPKFIHLRVDRPPVTCHKVPPLLPVQHGLRRVDDMIEREAEFAHCGGFPR
jgi:hypothetical protein